MAISQAARGKRRCAGGDTPHSLSGRWDFGSAIFAERRDVRVVGVAAWRWSVRAADALLSGRTLGGVAASVDELELDEAQQSAGESHIPPVDADSPAERCLMRIRSWPRTALDMRGPCVDAFGRIE